MKKFDYVKYSIEKVLHMSCFIIIIFIICERLS